MNIEKDIINEIHNLVDRWEFHDAFKLNDNLLSYTNSKLNEYLELQLECGAITVASNLLSKHGFIKIENLVSPKLKDNFSVISIIKEFYIPAKHGALSSKCKNSEIFNLSFKDNKKELLEYFVTNFNVIFKEPLIKRDIAILTYAINTLIESSLLDYSTGIKLINFFVESRSISEVNKKYIVNSLVEYFISTKDVRFFALREQYYNHLQKIYFFLHKHSEETGSNILYKKLNNAISIYNNTSIKIIKKEKPKVAVCISGMFRGSDLAIRSIYKNIVSPLNADVFFHSWDVWQPWTGVCGGSSESWTWRLFDCDRKILCPKPIRSFNDFKNHFPTAAKIIDTPIYSDFNEDVLISMFKPTSFLIENENKFLGKLGNNKINFMSRDSYNQAKMFYGIYKSTELMLMFEKQTGMEYDYVIRARPDCGIIDELKLPILEKIKEGCIATDMMVDAGPIDQFYISRKNTHVQMASLWKNSISSDCLSPFESFPKYDAHALMLLWMIKNQIEPIKCPVRRHFALSTSKNSYPEGIVEALKYDFRNTAQHLVKDQDVVAFLGYMLGMENEKFNN